MKKNERTDLRESAEFTQSEAAALANVSLATWRRWEEDPATVSARTRTQCEGALAKATRRREAVDEGERWERVWGQHPVLTPRQAAAIASTLAWWLDVGLQTWLDDPSKPLHEIGPFENVDLRVMMLVDDNKAWAAKAQERCRAVYDEIQKGVLPFDRAGCFFDELLMAAVLEDAEIELSDCPELFESIPARPGTAKTGDDFDDESEVALSDDDWESVSDAFDDMCRWDEWQVPVRNDHPLLPAILTDSHPFSWFDLKPSTGPGYLQRLQGIVVEQHASTN